MKDFPLWLYKIVGVIFLIISFAVIGFLWTKFSFIIFFTTSPIAMIAVFIPPAYGILCLLFGFGIKNINKYTDWSIKLTLPFFALLITEIFLYLTQPTWFNEGGGFLFMILLPLLTLISFILILIGFFKEKPQ